MRSGSRLVSALLAAVLTSALSAPSRADDSARYYEDALARYERKDDAGAVIQLKNVLKADPGNLAAQLLMGRACLRKGEFAAAEVAFNEALRLGVSRAEVSVPLAQVLLDQGKQQELLRQIGTDGLPPGVRIEVLLLRARAQMELNQYPHAQVSLDEALRLDPRSVAVLATQAQLFLQSSRLADAERAAEQATVVAPADARGWAMRAAVAYARGAMPDALGHYDKALALSPSDSESLLGKASALMDVGRDGEALPLLERLGKSDAREPRGAYLRAVIAARRNQGDQVREALVEVTNLIDGLPRNLLTSRANLLLIAGLSHQALGSSTKAKEYFETYVRFFPAQAGARKPLASIYLAEGDAARALNTLEPIAAVADNDPEVLTLMASAYSSLKRHQKAADLLERAVRANAGAEARTQLGLSLLGTGQVGRGLDQLRSVVKQDPGQGRAAMALALQSLKDGQPRAAIDALTAALKRDPGNLALLNLLGVARAAAGDNAGARAAYEKVLAASPGFRAALLNLARLDAADSRLDAAQGRLAGVLKNTPDDVQALYELAMVQRRKGQGAEALKSLERAHSLDGKNVPVVTAQFDVLVESGARDKALALAREAASSNPDLAVQAMLARAQLMQSDIVGARTTLQNMTRAAEYNPVAQYKIARLQMMAGNRSGAAYSVDKALQGDPAFLPAKLLQVEIDLADGEEAKADARIKALQAERPGMSELARLQGDLAMLQKKPAIAAGFYRTALERQPATDAAIRLYQAQRAANQPEQALATLEGFARSRANDRTAQLALAEAYVGLGRFQAAEPLLLAALKHGEQAVLLNNLANVQFRLGRQNAVQTAERAYQLAPSDPNIADTLGWVLTQTGQGERGVKYLREARLREPGNPEFRFHLGAALAKTGRAGEARVELLEAVRIGHFDADKEAARLLETLPKN